MRVVFFVTMMLSSVSLLASEIIPFASDRWHFNAQGHRIEEHLGRQSLFLVGGRALIEDAEFMDGIIEYEVAFAAVRGFAGAIWRVQDPANYEQFYMRPHQSGNPDANQYTPCFNGLTGWQLYHGEGYGAPVTYDFDTWIPVRIVVSGDQAEIFVGDLESPALFVDELKRTPAAGAVGVNVANFGPAHFTNFRFHAVEHPPLVGRVTRDRRADPGSVMRWEISDTLSEKALDDRFELPQETVNELGWATLDCETTGLANISRIRALAPFHDTALARITVEAEDSRNVQLTFGYSDRVRLYLNGRLLYRGDNGYRSRDYRYLGTIGLFDAVTLPLNKGRNELVFAVSESFGGWGLKAAFGDLEGLTVNP